MANDDLAERLTAAFRAFERGSIELSDAALILGISPEKAKEVLESLSCCTAVLPGPGREPCYAIDHKPFQRSELFPASPIIPLAYQFNMLCDSNRLGAFSQAIRTLVKPGDYVLDLGCGTGILAAIAASCGARVTALELDSSVAAFARAFIKKLNMEDRVQIVNENALTFRPSELADVIICEMSDTGLVAELLVPVLNRAVLELAKTPAKIIPRQARTTLTLASVNFTNSEGFETPLVHFDRFDTNRIIAQLSQPVVLHDLNLTRNNAENFTARVRLQTISQGTINAVIIQTCLTVAPNIIVEGSDWLNPPLVVPCDEREVDIGEDIHADFSCQFGGGLETISLCLCGKQSRLKGKDPAVL